MKLGFLIAFLGTALSLFGAPINIGSPRVEHSVDPVGVSTNPRFSWHLVSEENGKRQLAYEIIAASQKDLLNEEKADLWKSGKVKSSNRQLIAWGGKKLKNDQLVFWKVRVTDESQKTGNWSETCQFKVGAQRKLGLPQRTSGFESNSQRLNEIYQDSILLLQPRIEAFSKGNHQALGNGASLQRTAREFLYHFDATSHLTQWIKMMDLTRTKEGFFPVQPHAPHYGSVSSDAAITTHLPLWWMGGDDDFVKQRWEVFESYFIAREQNDPTFKGLKWGQLPEEELSPQFLDLTSMGYTSRIIRELAGPAQQPLNVIRFKDYSARIRESFQRQYLNEKKALIKPSQTAQLLALRCGVLPENKAGQKIPEYQNTIIENLMASLHKDGPQVGSMGAYFLLQVLPLIGEQDHLVKMILSLNDEQLKVFIGAGISEWMMSQLVGIDAGAPGFKLVQISPRIPNIDSLQWVKGHYDSPSGRVAVNWEQTKEGHLDFEVTIPPGVLSRIQLPCKKDQEVTESGKIISEVAGIELTGKSDTHVNFVTQSGRYRFQIR